MKNYISFLLFMVVLCQLEAQKHEVGVFFGGSNGITDIGKTGYVDPLPKKTNGKVFFLPLNFGLLYRYNLNPQQSLRVGVNYTDFKGNDYLAKEDYRHKRDMEYMQTIYEASVLFEYNFFAINAEQKTAHSPYIFAGLGVFGYKHPTYDVINRIDANSPEGFTPEVSFRKDETKFSYTIPFGAGYKYKFNYNWVIGAEVGFRPTFVDDIDKAYAEREDFTFVNEEGLSVDENLIRDSNDRVIGEYQIGDRSNFDWYVFSGLTLTYTFGRQPCYCD